MIKIWEMLVNEKRVLLGFYMLSLSAVAVYPKKTIGKKFIATSQYRNWKSGEYSKKIYNKDVVVNYIRE